MWLVRFSCGQRAELTWPVQPGAWVTCRRCQGPDRVDDVTMTTLFPTPEAA